MRSSRIVDVSGIVIHRNPGTAVGVESPIHHFCGRIVAVALIKQHSGHTCREVFTEDIIGRGVDLRHVAAMVKDGEGLVGTVAGKVGHRTGSEVDAVVCTFCKTLFVDGIDHHLTVAYGGAE